MGIQIREVECRSVINRVRGMDFKWSINPYRGCQHGCQYCFARVTHTYFDLSPGEDFSRVLFVKINALQVLRQELRAPSWRREPVAIGTATDPYQPIEGRYRITRGILEALRDYRNPMSLITKNSMIVRDLDVLTDLARRTSCQVFFSITTLERDLWRKLEPGTPPPEQRLRALKRLVQAGIPAGVFIAPIIPGITSSETNLSRVVKAAADHGARYIGANVLYLKPGVKEWFFGFLEREFPELVPGYTRLYRSGAFVPLAYKKKALARFEECRARHELLPRRVHRKEPEPEEQLALAI